MIATLRASVFIQVVLAFCMSAYAEVKIQSQQADEIRIQFDLPTYTTSKVKIENQDYLSIEAADIRNLDQLGEPALPQVGVDLMVPFHTTHAEVRIENPTWEKQSSPPIVPSKGALDRSVNPDTVPYLLGAPYSQRGTYPEHAVKAGIPFQFRDTRGVNVRLIPFKYDFAAHELWTLKRATLVVRLSQNRALPIQAFSENRGRLDGDFLDLYHSHFRNFEHALTATRVSHFVPESARAVVITHPKFKSALADYLKWKSRKGMEFEVETIAESGATHTDVLALVRKHYESRRISHVVLIGDAEDMPYHPGKSGNAVGNEADPMYGLLEGDDSYPELFVSRISAKNNTDVTTTLNKAIRYERNPEVNGTWYETSTGIASNEAGSSGLKDRDRADLLRNMLMGWHYGTVDQVYDPSANITELMAALNRGRGFINYIGHGSTTAWVTSGMSTRHIDQLENGGRLPFIVSVACVNGNFKYSGEDSFAERWVKAGTPDKPKGALTIFASSTNQSWVPPTVGQKAISELLIQGKYRSAAALFTHGSIAVLEDGSSSALQTFETWHTFGDGTVEVRTQKPSRIAMRLPQTHKEGQGTLRLDLGSPGIQVGITLHGRLVASAVSDASGIAHIEFKDCPKAGDVFEVLATGTNRIPAEGRISVTL